MKYPKLFAPGKIGNLTVKNRIVMAALAMGVAEKDQTIGPAFLAYLMERAKGGVGMIVLENTRVDDKHGVAAECQASVARDEQIAPLARPPRRCIKRAWYSLPSSTTPDARPSQTSMAASRYGPHPRVPAASASRRHTR